MEITDGSKAYKVQSVLEENGQQYDVRRSAPNIPILLLRILPRGWGFGDFGGMLWRPGRPIFADRLWIEEVNCKMLGAIARIR